MNPGHSIFSKGFHHGGKNREGAQISEEVSQEHFFGYRTIVPLGNKFRIDDDRNWLKSSLSSSSSSDTSTFSIPVA